MKKFNSLPKMLLIVCGLIVSTITLQAQSVGFYHVSNESNTVGHITYIDNELLNENPSAKFVYSQRYVDEDNNHPTGIWYNSSNGRWAIYNEDLATMSPNVGFNIIIPPSSSITTHVANASNTYGHQSTMTGYTQDDYVFHSNYYNEFYVYNPFIYGHYYTGENSRTIYEENFNDIPTGAAFFVVNANYSDAQTISVSSSTLNILGPSMRIDSPVLNGKPDAVFVYSHYWGYPSGEYAVYLNDVTEAYYFDGYWHIYKYDGDFVNNIWFDILLPNENLEVKDQASDAITFQIFPNPATDQINIQSSLDLEHFEIVNLAGQKVMQNTISDKNSSINISALPQGVYVINVKTTDGWMGKKFLKK